MMTRTLRPEMGNLSPRVPRDPEHERYCPVLGLPALQRDDV